MKSKTIISLVLFLLAAAPPGCAFRKKQENPAPVSPLNLPTPAVPLPAIPPPPPIPQPEIVPSPNQAIPSFTTPNSSPVSPAPDASPSKFPE